MATSRCPTESETSTGREISKLTQRHREQETSKIKLTREGWVFLVVFAFITVGSVLRNVNLMILMAGMMYAPLILNWRLGVRRIKSLHAFRRLPRHIHAQELSQIQWTCENGMSGMAAWNLVIHDRIEKAPREEQTLSTITRSSNRGTPKWFRWPRFRTGKWKQADQVSEVKIGFVVVAADQSAVQSYRIFFGERGKYYVGPARLTTTFPFGLISSQKRFRGRQTCFVGPETGRLNPVWEQRIQSLASGSESIKRQRALQEDEFYALRPWRSGDSKKNIHWRTTAKLGQPIIRQYDQQNNRDFALILDLHATDDDPLAAHRCELALSFSATALLKIGSLVHGQVAVGICGDESEQSQGRSAAAVISKAMQQFAVAQTSPDPDLVNMLFSIAPLVSPGTPIYIVSSREMPNQFELDHLLSMEQDPSNPEQIKIARRLKRVVPAIRWLNVESDEFKQMFTQEQNSATQAGLKKLSTRWGAHVRR